MNADTIIVGGGIAGLTAATYLARAGHSTVVLEKAGHLGGRAQTTNANGFRLNYGPHALYKTGHGAAVLAELGVAVAGGTPSGRGSYAIYRGKAETLPVGLLSMLTTGLLTLTEKLAVARVLAGIGKLDVEPWRGKTVREWVESVSTANVVRDYLYAVVRVSTYANMPDLLDAAAALEQVRAAYAGGVQYLDGGWQSMVDGLRRAAVDAGATLATGAHVTGVDGGTAELADGTTYTGRAVVIAASPGAVTELTGHAWNVTAVRAACLDVALRSLPRPRAVFALGIDQPTYYSQHTRFAALAPDGGAVVHVAKYLAPDDVAPAPSQRAELEAVLDLLQPGWRDCVADARFLPRITVCHAVRGPHGRPPVVLSPGLYLAGDWVGNEGMLADAAFASGRRAAAAIIAADAHTHDIETRAA